MKICVISDSHGRRGLLEKVLESENFNWIFFLGDGLNDFKNTNLKNIKKVSGNCDLFSCEAGTLIFSLNGIKIMLTHGHLFKVKAGNNELIQYAKKQGIKLVCYGHTHKESLNILDNIMLLNPGALKDGKYAIITIDNSGGIGVDFARCE